MGGGGGLVGAIQERCLFNIMALMVGNCFGDQAAKVLHIQMNYKYKRMIFFS